MIDRNRKAVQTPFQFVSFGLVGAATIILFSVASVSLLSTDKKPLTRSSSVDGIFRHTDSNGSLNPTLIHSPILDPATTLPRFAPQGMPISETAEVTGARSADLPLPEHDASETTSELPDANLTRSSPVSRTEALQVSSSDQAITEPRPVADEVSVKPDIAPVTVPTENIEERRDDAYPNFQTDQNQPAKLEYENPPSLTSQKPPVHRHFLSADSALRARVQKECGPIVFPALRRHCMATFGIRHR